MAVETPICDFGWKAPEFTLPATDGKVWALADIRGPKGTLIMFICNHCPYVIAVLDRIIRDARELRDHGITSVAIMSNDPRAYAEDSFENMQAIAAEKEFPFPYLLDESQAVAKAYEAACTPDFFGFNFDLELHYRGRLDESRTSAVAGARRDLFEAMTEIARSGTGPADQIASIGCSIKWREDQD